MFRVTEAACGGLGAFAVGDVESGAILLEESPLAAVQLSDNARRLRLCDTCLRSDPAQACAAGCGAAFCSDACQGAGAHLCAAASPAAGEFLAHAARCNETFALAGRLAALGRASVLDQYTGGLWWDLVALPPDIEAGSPDEAGFRKQARRMAARSAQLLTAAGHEMSAEAFGRLMGALLRNGLCVQYPHAELQRVAAEADVARAREMWTAAVEQEPESDDGEEVLSGDLLVSSSSSSSSSGSGSGSDAESESGSGAESDAESGAESESDRLSDRGAGAQPPDDDALLALLLDRLPQPTGTGFFPQIARLNHSCDPNAEVRFPYGDSRAVLTAVRDVGEGEELTISYIENDELSTPERQQALAVYQFRCGCRRCASSAGRASKKARVGL